MLIIYSYALHVHKINITLDLFSKKCIKFYIHDVSLYINVSLPDGNMGSKLIFLGFKDDL